MLILTLVPWLRELHPPQCNNLLEPQTCKGPTASQIGVLLLALTFLAFGSAGIRPSNISFGVDQFDPTTEEGRKGINSFFNWYYTTFTMVLIISQTVVVYIQDHISWVVGFGIPALLMFCGIVLFFLGTRVYVYVKPEGSVFSDIAYAIVAAYRKRKLKLPALEGNHVDGIFYDPPLKGSVVTKFPLSNEFR
jgi:dipeptide/tripeptide permease